jgi:hypothetical protein
MTPFFLAIGIVAKLVIVTPGQPAIATDYPSMQRCQRAAENLKNQQQAAVDKWFADTQVTVGAPFQWLDPNNKSLGITPAYPRPTVAQVYCVRR